MGGAIAGIGIEYIGFSSSLAVTALIALAIGIPSVMLWRSSHNTLMPKTERLLEPLKPGGRSSLFWLVSIAIMFNSLAIYPMVNLLLPVFMSQNLGYSYIAIGLLFMLYNAISAIATWLTVHLPLSFKRAAILTVVSIFASVFLAGPAFFFPALLLTLAFTRGYGIGFFEYSVMKVAKDSKNLSVDIGWLHVPMRLAEFSSILAAGFVAQMIGYSPIFIATGIFFGVFSFMSLYILRCR